MTTTVDWAAQPGNMLAKTAKITLQSANLTEYEKGRKLILVNGLVWGTFAMEHLGGHGVRYLLTGADGAHIEVPYDPPSKSGNLRKLIVDGDKWYRRRNDVPHGQPIPKIEERLLTMARGAIAAGHLKHPDAVAAAHKASHEAWQQSVADEARRKANAFKRKAEHVITTAPYAVNLKPGQLDSLVERIVEAMEFAEHYTDSQGVDEA